MDSFEKRKQKIEEKINSEKDRLMEIEKEIGKKSMKKRSKKENFKNTFLFIFVGSLFGIIFSLLALSMGVVSSDNFNFFGINIAPFSFFVIMFVLGGVIFALIRFLLLSKYFLVISKKAAVEKAKDTKKVYKYADLRDRIKLESIHSKISELYIKLDTIKEGGSKKIKSEMARKEMGFKRTRGGVKENLSVLPDDQKDEED